MNASRRIVIELIAVLAGAVIGTLIAGFLEWLFAGMPFATALFSPGPYFLALVTVALFAVAYAKMAATPAVLVSLGVGVLLPTVVDRFAFGSSLSLGALLLANLAFAVVALSAYRFVHANGAVREIAGHAADEPRSDATLPKDR